MKYVLVLLPMFITACGDAITPHNYETAAAACTQHGGLNYVYKKVTKFNPAAKCADGVRIENLPFEKK